MEPQNHYQKLDDSFTNIGRFTLRMCQFVIQVFLTNYNFFGLNTGSEDLGSVGLESVGKSTPA
ncbi:MAG: hypothetical protein ACKPKO_03175, partial [Candidatus Fonsibacter sp.]